MTNAPLLLGIDTGLTLTKAVAFDLSGREIARGEARVPQSTPQPRWVERDMEDAWQGVVDSVRQVLDSGDVSADQIVGIGLSAHGDSLFPIDANGRPIRPAILSLDSRAHTVIERWRTEATLEQALPLTGQVPFASALPALLAWLVENDPDSAAHMRWALGCKDWTRFKLTGTIGTDFIESSGGFCDIQSQTVSAEAFDLFGLGDLSSRIPEATPCLEIAGTLTDEAARLTGLRAGTPVTAGLHDVAASAIGAGCVHPGQLAMVAGTWSINLVVADQPATDPRWVCRNFVEPGQWFSAAWSPASATNLEWFVTEFCAEEVKAAISAGISPYQFVNDEAGAIWDQPSDLFFHPFLYGSPHGDHASAGLFGMRGWHKRGHVLRAILEGITFNHKTHVDALKSKFPISEARLTGGGAQSVLWSQLFADALGIPVVITDAREAGARGAALCAGVAVGIYPTLPAATDQATRILRRHEPDAKRHEQLQSSYATYLRLVEALGPVWMSMDLSAAAP